MFWALFDQTNIENFETTHPKFEITSDTGKILFAVYLISAVLVGINMLIAMMNNSFEYVAVSWRIYSNYLESNILEFTLIPQIYRKTNADSLKKHASL